MPFPDSRWHYWVYYSLDDEGCCGLEGFQTPEEASTFMVEREKRGSDCTVIHGRLCKVEPIETVKSYRITA